MSTIVLAALFLAACGNEGDTLAPDAAVTLSMCDGGSCSFPADSHTPIVVAVCTPVAQGRANPFNVSLKLSSGTWQNPSDPAHPDQTAVSLAAYPCVYPSFIPTNIPGSIRLDATFAGIDAVARIQTVPATLLSVSVTPTPEVLPSPIDGGAVSAVQLIANVRAVRGGRPSAGTTVTFQIDSAVPDGSAVVFPESAAVDDGGNAKALVTSSKLTSRVTVLVTASATDVDQSNFVTQDVVLQALPSH